MEREVLHIYVVYLDALFFTNFFLDFICLLSLSFFCGRHVPFFRIVGVAAAGSVAGVLCFCLVHRYALYLLLVHLVVNPGMVCAAFYPQSVRRCLLCLALFYGGYIFLGGLAEYVQRWLVPGWPLEVILGICAVLLAAFSAVLSRYRQYRRNYARVVLQNREDTVVCRAFCDSGNRLRDPYLKLPVSIVPEALKERLRIRAEQIRLVPFTTVEGKSRLMEVATLPVILIGEKGHEEAVAPGVIGFAGDEVFRDKRYDMILHGDYINDREK